MPGIEPVPGVVVLAGVLRVLEPFQAGEYHDVRATGAPSSTIPSLQDRWCEPRGCPTSDRPGAGLVGPHPGRLHDRARRPCARNRCPCASVSYAGSGSSFAGARADFCSASCRAMHHQYRGDFRMASVRKSITVRGTMRWQSLWSEPGANEAAAADKKPRQPKGSARSRPKDGDRGRKKGRRRSAKA